MADRSQTLKDFATGRPDCLIVTLEGAIFTKPVFGLPQFTLLSYSKDHLGSLVVRPALKLHPEEREEFKAFKLASGQGYVYLVNERLPDTGAAQLEYALRRLRNGEQ
jgi:hypothetical protein